LYAQDDRGTAGSSCSSKRWRTISSFAGSGIAGPRRGCHGRRGTTPRHTQRSRARSSRTRPWATCARWFSAFSPRSDGKTQGARRAAVGLMTGWVKGSRSHHRFAPQFFSIKRTRPGSESELHEGMVKPRESGGVSCGQPNSIALSLVLRPKADDVRRGRRGRVGP
jgi:hypothetical protein